MKALDEYFLMVVFTLLLNRVRICGILCLIWTEQHGNESEIIIHKVPIWDASSVRERNDRRVQTDTDPYTNIITDTCEC